MTQNQAYVLNAVLGTVVIVGGVILLAVVGANEGFQLAAAMVGLVGMSFNVGLISFHYEQKGIEHGEEPNRR